MLIDDVLPGADFTEHHSVSVAADPARTLAAAGSATVGVVPLLVGLMAIRGLPELVRRRNPFAPSTPVLAGFERLGFAVAAASREEVVIVGIGRFWRLGGGLRPVRAGEFADFADRVTRRPPSTSAPRPPTAAAR